MSGISLVLLSSFLALTILSFTLWYCSPAGTRMRQAWHRPLLLAFPPLSAVLVGFYEDASLLSLTGPIAPAVMLLLALPQWWLMRGTFHCRTCSAVYFDADWSRHVAYRCKVCRGYHAHGHGFSWHRGRSDADLSDEERFGPPTVFVGEPADVPAPVRTPSRRSRRSRRSHEEA